MAEITFDRSHFPLVVSRFPAEFDDDELNRYFNAFRALHDREQKFLVIIDISHAGGMSRPTVRRKAADFANAERERSARLCMGAAQIAPSTLVRAALTAINWLSPPPYPAKVVATNAEAMEWLRMRARETGLPFPESAVDVATPP